jgi:hypothetical protein
MGEIQGGLMNGLFRVGTAQTEVKLYRRRTDKRNRAFMGGGCIDNAYIIRQKSNLMQTGRRSCAGAEGKMCGV